MFPTELDISHIKRESLALRNIPEPGRMLQKVVVFTTLHDSDTPLIACGARLASAFGKEVCLFFQASGAFHSLEIDAKLEQYRQVLNREIPRLPVSVLVGNFHGEKLATVLADEQEAVLLVAGASRFRKLSSALQNSPIPFLFVSEDHPFRSEFRKVVFPVDLREQNKDAMKWILWFGKYNHSEIVAVGARDHSRQNRQHVERLLSSLKKLLVKSAIPHKIYRGSRSSLSIHREGLAAAQELDAGLLVLLGSSTYTLLDLVLGLPEEKIVRHAGPIPVLVVNPRRETYLICE